MLFATSAWQGGLPLCMPLSAVSLSLSLSLSLSIPFPPTAMARRSSRGIERAIYRGRYISLGEPLDFHTSAPESVHMYACIARGLASRSSFRYPFPSRLFEATTTKTMTTTTTTKTTTRVVPVRRSFVSEADRPASGASHYHLGHFLFRGSSRD